MTAGTKPGKAAPVAPQTVEAGGNIENIRDILFGAQMRQYDRRFQRLEELLAKECADIREELKRRLDSLETYARQELKALDERVTAESGERSGAVSALAQRVTDLAGDTRSRTAKLEESLAAGLKELRQTLLDQGKQLTEELRAKNEALTARTTSGLESVRADSVDRAELGSLLTEVAMRLSAERGQSESREP